MTVQLKANSRARDITRSSSYAVWRGAGTGTQEYVRVTNQELINK